MITEHHVASLAQRYQHAVIIPLSPVEKVAIGFSNLWARWAIVSSPFILCISVLASVAVACCRPRRDGRVA
jgi:hypothetical protein